MREFYDDEDGATAVEYALLVVMMSVWTAGGAAVLFVLYCIGVASGVL